MSSVWKKSGTVTIIISKVKGQRKKKRLKNTTQDRITQNKILIFT